jgi:hypothetical protein
MIETIPCRFCGHVIPATATECEKCGGGTPYGVEIEATDALRALDVRQRYEYRMVQIPPNIMVSRGTAKGNEAARYLERIVNEQARQGWGFVRVDTIGVQTPPGCLGSILGGQVTTLNYYVITFRKDRQISPVGEAGSA